MKLSSILLESAWLLAASLPVTLAATPANVDIVWSTNAHAFRVRAVAFSGDSRFLASGSGDQTALVWRTTNSAPIRTVGDPDGVESIALSSDGQYVAIGGGGGKTAVWQVSDGSRLWTGGPDNRLVYSEAFSPDDSYLAIGRADGINVLHAAAGIGIPFGEPEGEVFAVTFSPDGQSLASANADHHASLWRVPEGTLIRNFVGHSNAVNSVDFSPDGRLLATASADGTARVWNVTNGEVVRIIEGGGGARQG